MREIKFRAWLNGQMTYDLQNHYEWEFRDKYTLTQFTGLFDRNGKEIYEDDIIDFAGLKPIKIIWKENGFKSSMHGSEPIHLTQEGLSVFAEVIGNIYENPELLN